MEIKANEPISLTAELFEKDLLQYPNMIIEGMVVPTSELKAVTLGENIVKISGYAFTGDFSSLTEIVLSPDIEKIELPYVTVNVHCSKGTYIRTLASDIGDKLGCGGCISALERTASGPFLIENAITPEELLALAEKGEEEKALLPLDSFFDGYEKIYLDKKRADRVKNGVPIYFKGKEQGKMYRVYDENGNFISLSQAATEDGRECLKLIKGFYK
jgi:tRNA pseudouridine55 synthase